MMPTLPLILQPKVLGATQKGGSTAHKWEQMEAHQLVPVSLGSIQLCPVGYETAPLLTLVLMQNHFRVKECCLVGAL